MWLTVKLLLGRRCLLQVSENEKVFMLKRLVSKQLHVPEKQQRLLFRGQVLADNKRLSDYCIGPNSTLNVILRPMEKASPERPSQSPSQTQSPSQPQFPPQFQSLWPQLGQILAKHFSPQDAEKVLNRLKEEHRRCLQQMSLDDLERISKLLVPDGKQEEASGSSVQSKGDMEPRGDRKCNVAPKEGFKPEKSPGK
ncbi:ubiquitin-like protein 4B [Dromiciops gliroides]|uniref:ubiquitin-like protein 4B n=1 Tax=Dromiciops gliroides TaxID=33562 RepID=UPI001CC44D8D|nr:ubiquitin-like protein 4B [Dromiciops gliroides]